MQPTGGGETSRGLARFRSAPATWLDALLESVEEDDDLLKPTPHQQSVAQVPPTARSSSAAVSYVDPVGLFDGGVASSGSGFLRQSSSPAEFLAQISSGSDSYFSHFELPGNNYDYLPLSIEASSSSSKRPREQDLERPSAKLSSQLKEEDQSVHIPRGISGLLDPEMEKLLEDSVPCRVRAKRGCATHPRSIAERVRRTRISDRIRKLQELVPNMDKQTNTSDMLEEAVEYVKFLQRQIQELTEQQKNCTCVSRD